MTSHLESARAPAFAVYKSRASAQRPAAKLRVRLVAYAQPRSGKNAAHGASRGVFGATGKSPQAVEPESPARTWREQCMEMNRVP